MLTPNDSDWVMVTGIILETTVVFDLDIPSGISQFGLFPEYNYAAYLNLIESLHDKPVEIEKVGSSREMRDILLLHVRSENAGARDFFIQARDHSYETAGSYCIEGILDFLLSEDPVCHYIRSKFSFHILPMSNPDGVYNGMSRLTWERGANMNRVHTEADKAHDALKKAIDSVKPFVHMNIHNWTIRSIDGLLANDRCIADRICSYMPDDAAHYKKWVIETREDFCKSKNVPVVPVEDLSWKDYCYEHFGARGVTFEFPWFTLNTAAMKRKGKQALIALALSVIEEDRL
ncbi:MAG: M14 family zinc carboxypeptidase [Bacillota bacterium]|nr:M14 family zinc carboxypeptidase [Bacillota bacterium]